MHMNIIIRGKYKFWKKISPPAHKPLPQDWEQLDQGDQGDRWQSRAHGTRQVRWLSGMGPATTASQCCRGTCILSAAVCRWHNTWRLWMPPPHSCEGTAVYKHGSKIKIINNNTGCIYTEKHEKDWENGKDEVDQFTLPPSTLQELREVMKSQDNSAFLLKF